MYLKQKKKKNQKKNQIKTNFLKILRIKQKVLTMICLKNILIIQYLLFWQKKLFEIKDKNKNIKFVNVIKSGIIDLKNEIEKMSKEEKTIEKPNEIVNIVDDILEFNDKIQKHSGIGLKNLKIKLDNYYILCAGQKNLQNNYIKV